jgi:hypothetical protein
MKAIRSRIFAFLMIGVVLTLSTGMGLVEHTCLMSGKKTASAEHRKGCCAKKSTKAASHAGDEATIKADNCCEVETQYIHVDFVSFQEKFAKLFANLYAMVAEKLVDVFNALVGKSDTACSYTNSSPPLAGRALLTRHCILNV